MYWLHSLFFVEWCPRSCSAIPAPPDISAVGNASSSLRDKNAIIPTDGQRQYSSYQHGSPLPSPRDLIILGNLFNVISREGIVIENNASLRIAAPTLISALR